MPTNNETGASLTDVEFGEPSTPKVLRTRNSASTLASNMSTSSDENDDDGNTAGRGAKPPLGFIGDDDVEAGASAGSKRGCQLRWARITKAVEVHQQSAGLMRGSIAKPTLDKSEQLAHKPTTKTILDNVSGSASPGEILALMGPSGSGKTSLLDVLSGRSKYDSGTITLDGVEVTGHVMKRLKRKIAYVKQADVFFDHLTVRDQLTYTALLRLPSSWSKSRKYDEVNRTLRQLRLTKCADTAIHMVSGGERKRVNIGTELLTDPSIVILDEPTSGLDSTSAVALIRMLHGLARGGGKTIITSIHQPSSAVFRGFDKLMLLADGHTIYFGSPVESLSYLRDRGYVCPSGYNASDHWMDLLVVDSALEEGEEDDSEDERDDFDEDAAVVVATDRATTRRFSRMSVKKAQGRDGLTRKQLRAMEAANETPRAKLIEAWDDDAFASRIEEEDALLNHAVEASSSGEGDGGTSSPLKERKYNTSWWTQFKVLMHRSMKNSRSAIFTPLNLIKSACIGLICGLLWFQLPYTEKAVFDRSSYYFFTMTYWVFDAMFNALMAFPGERTIILKERASGSYHLSAYFMAKTISEAPSRLLLPSIYMIISYWMAGVNPKFSIFLASTVCTLLSVLAGESIGLLVGAIVFDFERSLVIMTVVALALMIAGGFFVQNVPVFMAWIKYLSPFKYAYDASVQIVFSEPVPCDGSGVLESCEGGGEGYASQEDVFSFLGIQGTIAFNVGLMLVMITLPRLGAYYALRRKKAAERT